MEDDDHDQVPFGDNLSSLQLTNPIRQVRSEEHLPTFVREGDNISLEFCLGDDGNSEDSKSTTTTASDVRSDDTEPDEVCKYPLIFCMNAFLCRVSQKVTKF